MIIEIMTWEEMWNYVINGSPSPDQRVEKTEEEWRELLSYEQFRIARKGGSEKPFHGNLHNATEVGHYDCVCCKTRLFDSAQKFDSNSGWPSFTCPATANAIKYEIDSRFEKIVWIEISCNTCDAFLGSVFPDGPDPFNVRLCVMSESIELVK